MKRVTSGDSTLLASGSSPRWVEGDPPTVSPCTRGDHRGVFNSLAPEEREGWKLDKLTRRRGEGRRAVAYHSGARPWPAMLMLLLLLPSLSLSAEQHEPIRLHPENPHYFLFRGKPTVLITSAEHYGAVLNPDFDYLTYLNVLQAAGLNLTRTVNGNYLESKDGTIIPWAAEQNTLCPRPGRYLAPWARSSTPGYHNGGNKFDLNKWDQAYFGRLKDFVREAGKRGIVVEFNMNYVMYGEDLGWVLNPMNAKNNVNGVGNIPFNLVNTLTDSGVVATQDALLRKTVTELNGFDNVYYEICDEPYISHADQKLTDDWQNHLVTTFLQTEAGLPNKHMIAWNYANFSAEIVNPNSAVSVFNFHYAFPPAAVPLNYRWNKAIAFDETHEGTVTRDRRREAWAFILSGGAVYNNLDWSFALDDPTGSGKVEQPGGRYSGVELRKQLKILKDFIHSLDFIRMIPNNSIVQGMPSEATAYALVEPGRAYTAYIMDGEKLNLLLDVGAGRYRAEWLNPRTGIIDKTQELQHAGGTLSLNSPSYVEDIALRLMKTGD
jgi:collagenase-like protein with putative collagen-binding domain